jgi:hypothetical protein
MHGALHSHPSAPLVLAARRGRRPGGGLLNCGRLYHAWQQTLQPEALGDGKHSLQHVATLELHMTYLVVKEATLPCACCCRRPPTLHLLSHEAV